ncbi:MAG: dihydrofolate synthase / folylpolyglutamate synthase [Solirubrobacteraceae bacterium]|jgi:dihydrofolate synthase/folylpolyglutamate synthase|nr:dihydrofolate synthase / folylpolyglutamate synthase [Solirubrobacteraceae bacterium]
MTGPLRWAQATASPPLLPSGWTAADADQWLLSLELFGMRFGLDRMRRLMAELGAPHEAFRAIHVVGTNGKSSTVRMIAALLAQHGVRAGAYLSPHLVSYAERIRVDGADVSPHELAAAVGRARAATELVDRTLEADDGVTQFEALTAAAYAHLAQAAVEVAVVEAGLGGRWDATNVVDAQIAVLTNVGLEHTRWLGSTVAEIAREKLAVLAPGATLVLGADLHADADAQARIAAEREGATILRAPARLDELAPGLELLARGAFQRRNFAVACTAARAYLGSLEQGAIRAAAGSTEVPGRFDVVADAGGRGEIVLDGAHNSGGVAALVESLPAFLAGRPLVAVVSVLDDKDARAMLEGLLALCAGVVFTASAHPRALEPAALAALAGDLPAHVARRVGHDPRAAMALARELAGPGGVVLATGSIYLVADLMRPAGAPGSML